MAAEKVSPGLLGKAHSALIALARESDRKLRDSLDGGHRGPAERSKQIEHLLDYQEYLLAADVVAGYEK
jgi:hypothetical protein